MATEPIELHPVTFGHDPEYHDFRIQVRDPKDSSSAPVSVTDPQAKAPVKRTRRTRKVDPATAEKASGLAPEPVATDG